MSRSSKPSDKVDVNISESGFSRKSEEEREQHLMGEN